MPLIMDLKNIGDSSSVNSEWMVYDEVIGSWAREKEILHGIVRACKSSLNWLMGFYNIG